MYSVLVVLCFDNKDNQGPVARSMVSVNQPLIPWQRIGFDTALPMVKANHALSNSAQAYNT